MILTLEGILENVTGEWSETNLMRVMPDDEFVSSNSNATIALAAGRNAATINYTWAYEGEAQDGVMLITNGAEATSVSAVWVDSWHQNPQWIELQGNIDEQGILHVKADYGPEDQRFTWHIYVDASNHEHLRIRMDNALGEMSYQVVNGNYERPG